MKEEMKNISLTWKMTDDNIFHAEKEGYEIVVRPKAWIAPYWAIIKDGIVIDECYHHSPTKDELTAKVQAERVLDKLLNPIQVSKKEVEIKNLNLPTNQIKPITDPPQNTNYKP